MRAPEAFAPVVREALGASTASVAAPVDLGGIAGGVDLLDLRDAVALAPAVGAACGR